MASRAFLPIETERLTVRAMRRDDVTRFTEYRNDPEVWRFQDWAVPYTRDHAHRLIDSQEGLTGPTPSRWVQLAIDDGSGLVGDLAVWIADDAQLAMIGYTLAAGAQGRGYATEAAGALVERLFDELGIHRVVATLDPANVASARVLERLGFRYEGRSVAAAPVRGVWEDDDRYAVLADEYRAWQCRPRHPPATVELVPITHENVRAVLALHPHRSQERFVASVAESFADALAPEVVDGAPVVPWYRAIQADGELAGFVLTAEPTEQHPHPWLWRLIIDRWHQGSGIGRQTVGLLCERFVAQGASRVMTSWVEGPGSPGGFYRSLGFRPTGEVVDGETVAALALG